jgi:hypothetical protein
MVRYFFAWTPLVIVGTVVLLSLPWLGGIALLVVFVVVLTPVAALVWAAVSLARMATRAVSRSLHFHSGASAPPVAAARIYEHPRAHAAWARTDSATPHLGPSADAMSASGRDPAPGQTHLP